MRNVIKRVFAKVLSNANKDEGETIFHIPDVKVNGPSEIPLRLLVRHFTSMKQASQIPSATLYLIYSQLLSLDHLFTQYNQLIQEQDSSIKQYSWHRFISHQVLQLTSSLGTTIPLSTPITVPGLKKLIESLEGIFSKDIDMHQDMIQRGSIVFDSLQHLYKPGTFVSSTTSLGVPSGFRVVQNWYQLHRTLFGMEKSFHLELQFVIGLGNEFAVCTFESVLSSWMGAANRSVQDLPFVPLQDGIKLEGLKKTGEMYLKYSSGGARFLQHDAESIYLHSASSSFENKKREVHSAGRIMIDGLKGSTLGILATQGMDDASLAMAEVVKRYRRLVNDRKSLGNTGSSDSVLLLPTIPEPLLPIAWPALVGFSFAAKSWCHVLVSSLSEIDFNNEAFDQLVLDQEKKELIRALVKLGSGSEFYSDIIQGKSGGSIFLLHGPAGVGKTLTAEAIAEVLHRPLYYVTMGELGITPEVMENRLESILDLCSSWNAITLIDEADVFLEKRSTSDVLRNAMVCVMLRLLEYHQGILILTTNRVTEFDPAFESRVTVALKYESLNQNSREKVWENLLSRLSYPIQANLDHSELAQFELNGRQIKNAVRLALALAADQKIPVDQALCLKALKAANMGRLDMKTAQKF